MVREISDGWSKSLGRRRRIVKSPEKSDASDGSLSSGTVSLADEDGVRRILVDSLFGLWSTVNNLSRLRPSCDDRYRVTIFGSARTKAGHWVYEEVRRMCAGISALGCDIVTGGGPGLMEAANRGARDGQSDQNAENIGIRVHLPFEQSVNPFVEHAFQHGTFFTRLHQFVLMSDAYIVAPGGIGTLLETAMIWQLLQVRQLDVPLILVGPMWRGLVDWASSQMLRPGFELASPRDFQIPICVKTADEAVAVITEHHEKWASSAP
jgi:uncharacterized protein (TIGR00730 family)